MQIETFVPRFRSPPEFGLVLASKQTTISEVLLEPLTFPLFRMSDTQLVDFLVLHVDALINLAFSPKRSQVASIAFEILEHGNPSVTAAMIRHPKFHAVAMDIVTSSSSSMNLSRLASLILAVVTSNQSLFMTRCGFILQLLPFVHETSVFSLFKVLCAENEEQREVQEWMIGMGFLEILYQEVYQVDMEIGSDRMNENANVLCAYFALIHLCAKNRVFSQDVCTRHFVSALTGRLSEYPSFVEDMRWVTLAALYKTSTSEMMRVLFQPALELIVAAKNHASPAAVAAIGVLGRMLRFDEAVRPFLVAENVPVKIVNLMLNNPGHSILHSQCRRFLVDALVNPVTRENAIECCLRVIIDCCYQENRCLAVSMMEISRRVWKLSLKDTQLKDELQQVPEWSELVHGKIAERRILLRSPYGGPLATIV